MLAADTSLLMLASVTTNAATGAVLTTETYTRGGQTNLIRVTKTEGDTVVFRSQKFCHNGKPIAWFSFSNGTDSFSTVPRTPEQVVIDYQPSKEVRCVMIFGKDFIDGFYPTNGVYYPAPNSDLEFKNYK